MTNLRRFFDQAVNAAEQRNLIDGRLGRLNADDTYTMEVPNRPGYVYVRLGPDGQSGETIALNTSVSLVANLPVKLKRVAELGDLQVVSVDAQQAPTFAAGSPAIGNVGPHTHRRESGIAYEIEMEMLAAGRVKPFSGLIVQITPFRYQLADGSWNTWLGGEIDLTSYKPSAVGNWAWVLIGVDPETNTAVAATGDEYSYAIPLTIDLMDDITFTDYIPCGAVKIRYDDTNLDDWRDFKDAHVWFGGGGGATDLSNTPDSDSVAIESSTGENTDLGAATESEAGVMSAADKTKLNGIASGAQVNVGTNLGRITSPTAMAITSSTGIGTSLPEASGSIAGLLAAANFTKLAGIEANAQVNVGTNLGQTPTSTTVALSSSTGTPTTLQGATESNAGLLTAANFAKLSGFGLGARIYNSSAQTIPTSTFTALTFDSEVFDDSDYHSTVSNTSRFTIPETGIYIVGCHIIWATSAATGGRFLYFRRNGGNFIGQSQVIPQAAGTPFLSLTSMYLFTAADYVEAYVFHTLGSNLDVSATTERSPIFWIARLR